MRVASLSAIGRRHAWAIVLIAAFLPFLNTLDNGFHFDDEHAILRNHHLRDLGNIPSFFLDSATFSAEPGIAMYRPILLTTFAVNYSLGGYAPFGYHLLTLALHALACVGVLLLLSRFVPANAATAAAVLFAVHPIQTQALNYISSRSEVLAAAFVIWALWLALRHRPGWSALVFALGVLSKSTALHLLPLYLVYLWQMRLGARHVRRILPVLGVSAAYIIVISLDGFLPRSLAQDVRPWEAQILTQCKVILLYLHLLAMPVRLSIEHGVSTALWPSPTVIASGATIGSLLWLSFNRLRHRKLTNVRLGGLWFFAALTIPTVVPLTVIASEQRLYLPLVGVVLALAAISVGPPGQGRYPVFFVPLLGILSLLSWNRNQLWENELLLWSDAATKAPTVARVQANLALALHNAGLRDEAAVAYRQALRLDPEAGRAWNNFGVWLEEGGRTAAAEEAYLQAARQRFGGPRVQLGRLYLQSGQLSRARAQLDTALQLSPADPDAHLYLGRWYQLQGDDAAARDSYERALEFDPANAAAANNLGLLLLEKGDRRAGVIMLQRALKADGNLKEARLNLDYVALREEGLDADHAYERLWIRSPEEPALALAWAAELGRQQRWEEAVQLLEHIRETQPTDADLTIALADIYSAQARWPAAIYAYHEALSLRPHDLKLRNHLAAALAADGDLTAALAQIRQVLAVDPDNGVARRNLERLTQARPDRSKMP